MLIFISHARANASLAKALADALESLGKETFLSSRAGDLRADEDWLPSILDALQKSCAYIILLTPESMGRPWVNFEAGAAWASKKKYIFVRVQALSADDIPLPISSRQVYALDIEGELEVILEALGLPGDAAHRFIARFIEVAAEAVPAGEIELAWEGFQFEGEYYAWAGSLLNLDDRPSIAPPAGLLHEIKRRGFRLRWGNQDRLPHHLERGLAQVFATDRKKWRRPVMDKGRLLLVGP